MGSRTTARPPEPAAQGDLIVSAAGLPAHNPDDLFDALQAAAQAGTIELDVVRGTDERTIEVRFGTSGRWRRWVTFGG